MRHQLAFLLLAGAASVRAADGWEPPERIVAVATAAVQVHAAASAVVSAAPLDERLRLPQCAQPPHAEVMPRAGSSQVNVAVQCAGPTAWTVYVPVRVADLRKVLVARRGLPRGETLAADAVELQERDTAALPFGFFDDPDAPLGQALKRPLAAGSVVTPDALEAARLVRRGERVTLLGRAGAIEVRAEGRALADGGSGETIEVENLSSRRVVQGVVRDAGTVEVHL